MWKPTSKSSNLATLLGVRGLNYGLWSSSSLLPISVNKILEEHSHMCLFLCCPRRPSYYKGWAEELKERPYALQSLQYLPSGPLLKVCWPCTRPHLASVEWSKISGRDGCSQSHLQWSDPEVLRTRQVPSRAMVPAWVSCYWTINRNSAKGSRKTELTKDLSNFRRAYDFCYQAREA